MPILILIMFLLASLILVFGLFNSLLWLTSLWALTNMALAYIMFTHIWNKEREGEKEKLAQRIEELEAMLER